MIHYYQSFPMFFFEGHTSDIKVVN